MPARDPDVKVSWTNLDQVNLDQVNLNQVNLDQVLWAS